MLHEQNFKDPLSLIMKNVDEESSTVEEGKDEALLPNEERLRTALEDLQGLIANAEKYVGQVAVPRPV
jgi:hypothetical protein